jgi:23S rRNA pseudouridine1911/1915/1917 synthase
VLLDIGGVFLDGARVKVASRKVRPGQVVRAVLGGALERATKSVGESARASDAASLPDYEIVHQDEEVVVVNKPAGLLTAPTPESDRNNLSDLLSRRLGRRVYVVHRLDLQTSGVLVFALTREANKALSEQFRAHTVDREYLAVVRGEWPKHMVTVEDPVGGKSAVTHFSVERSLGPAATVLRARLETGRTHQIRIHCEGVGHPVLGDPQYGGEDAVEPPAPRCALHATVLGFDHPRSGERLRFESPWPPELSTWLQSLGG